MAKQVLTNCYVAVNGVNLSDHCDKVTIEDNREPVDVTAFGATNKEKAKGVGDGKMTLDFFQDFAAASIHQTLSPLIASDSAVAVEVRPVNAARSATNPAALMQGKLFNYNFLDGSMGEASKISAEFENGQAGGGITYPTS